MEFNSWALFVVVFCHLSSGSRGTQQIPTGMEGPGLQDCLSWVYVFTQLSISWLNTQLASICQMSACLMFKMIRECLSFQDSIFHMHHADK